MKIALNATLFRPGRIGGMETYFRNLLFSLQKADERNFYSLLCDNHYTDEFPSLNENFKVLSCNFTQPSPGWLLRAIIRNIIKIDILRPIMNRVEVDLIHHPFSIMNPLHVRTPSVLTFHDMQHEFFPGYFSRYELKVRQEFFRPSAEQATRIIAISEHAKSSLVERYEIPPEKIDVIYNGVNSQYQIIEDQNRLEQIRLKYGLHTHFLYYPAATWPHKNHKTLLSALKLLRDRYRFDGQLVLTGIAMRANTEIMDEIVRMGLEDAVKVLGYLPNEELPCLYNLARLMVFPSLFEGFGIPLIEAMACGCPVVCSDVTSIPEVVGDVAVTFDPVSVDDIAEKVWAVWNDEALRQDMKSRGSTRAKLFSWDNTARQTMLTYEKAAGK